MYLSYMTLFTLTEGEDVNFRQLKVWVCLYVQTTFVWQCNYLPVSSYFLIVQLGTSPLLYNTLCAGEVDKSRKHTDIETTFISLCSNSIPRIVSLHLCVRTWKSSACVCQTSVNVSAQYLHCCLFCCLSFSLQLRLNPFFLFSFRNFAEQLFFILLSLSKSPPISPHRLTQMYLRGFSAPILWLDEGQNLIYVSNKQM